jgi:hypothetical protein
MTNSICLKLLLVVLWICSEIVTAAGQANPSSVVPESCVKYTPLVVPNAQLRITTDSGKGVFGDNSVKLSPYGTKWLIEHGPNFMVPGPWDTTIIVGDKDGTMLTFTAKNHANGGVHADWINERLLFIQVWSARVVSDDLILDVMNARFVYSEERCMTRQGGNADAKRCSAFD